MGRGEYGRRSLREGEKGWDRDDKGRLFRLEAGARVFRAIEDRDAAVEEVYTAKPCMCCPSILAGVAGHRDGLVVEFMTWAQRRDVHEVHDSETLAQWERERFGARLYLAAHYVLLFGVRLARFGERRAPHQPRLAAAAHPILDSGKTEE
jgi:hypothetical protein